MIELRRLTQLVVLSEELHFGRAAHRLQMSQPALSRSIRNLELELGAPLVERTTRVVTLTDVGQELVERSRPLLGNLEQVVGDAQRRAGVRRTLLRVGFKAGASGRIVTPVLRAFERSSPQVEVSVRRLGWADQTEFVLDRRVDVAFVVSIQEPDPRLGVLELLREHRVVAVPLEHPLAGRDTVSIAELADEAVVTSRTVPEEVARWWAVIPRPDGCVPLLGPSVESVEEMLEVVAMGRAICIVSRSIQAFYGRADLAFVPVVDVSQVPVALAWRADEDTATLRDFRRIAEQVVRELPD